MAMASTFLHAQIGIGVENPTEMLEVNGTSVVTDQFKLDGLVSYNGGVDGFNIIAIDPTSENINGEIRQFNGQQELMPIIVQPYEIQNIYRDDLNDLNLNIPSNKYIILLSNFEAIPSTINSSEPNLGLYKTAGNNNSNSDRTYGNFQIETFENGGTWHVRIGSTANTRYTSNQYTYKFDIVLFPKRFFKDAGSAQYNLNGQKTGTAPTTPNL